MARVCGLLVTESDRCAAEAGFYPGQARSARRFANLDSPHPPRLSAPTSARQAMLTTQQGFVW